MKVPKQAYKSTKKVATFQKTTKSVEGGGGCQKHIKSARRLMVPNKVYKIVQGGGTPKKHIKA